MAIKAVNIQTIIPFVSDDDPGKGTDQETAFQIGALDTYVMARLQDGLTEFTQESQNNEASAKVHLHAVAIQSAQFGIRGWKNFQDDKGNEIQFKTITKIVYGKKYEVVADELMMMIPIGVVMEIYRTLQTINQPTVLEMGN